MRLRASNFFLVGIALLLHGCGSDTPDVSSSSESTELSESASDEDIMAEGQFHTVRSVKEKYEVTYHDDTVIVSEEAMRYMAPIYDDPERLEFAIDAKPHLHLERGKVTIFPLAALRRVVSWQESGNKILVKTEPAILTDAIKDADIELVTKIDWTGANQQTSGTQGVQQTGPAWIQLFPAAYAYDPSDDDGSRTIKFKLKHKGVKVELTLIPEHADKLAFEIVASTYKESKFQSYDSREIAERFPNRRYNARNAHDYFHGNAFQPVSDVSEDHVPGGFREGGESGRGGGTEVGAKGFAKGFGHISNIGQALRISIADSELSNFAFLLTDLTVNIQLESVALDGIVGTYYLKVPLEIYIPMRIGLIPVTLVLGAEFSFRPIVETGSSKLCFQAKWQGSSGIKFTEGGFRNATDVEENYLGTCPDSETVSAALYTVGMGATVKFPSISLKIFDEAVVPNMHIKLDGKSLYEPGLLSAEPACQSGSSTAAWIVKATMSFFGLDVETESMLAESKKEWTCDGRVIETTYDRVNGKQVTESGS